MKKNLCVILSALVLAGSVTGCAAESSSQISGSTSQSKSSSTPQESQSQEQTAEFSYPMDGSVTLTLNMEPYDLNDVPDYARSNYYFERLQEETGIGLELIGAASGPYDTTQEFLLLLASGEYPDMFICNWVSFPGGPTVAMSDGYIQSLDDYADWLPNLNQYLADNPDINRMIRTDAGELYSAPWLRQEGTDVETGLVVRKDWLDQVNLDVPTTIDELHDVLVAFKNNVGVTTPLTFELRWLWLETASASLSSPYNCVYPFFVEDNTVKFGPLEEGYKEFISTMASWYAEGLLDTDIASVDKSTVQAKFANGEAGVSIQQSGNVHNCVKVLSEASDKYEVVAIPSLVKNKGDKPGFSHYRLTFDGGFAITMSTQTKHPEEVCRFMDYLFSKEGAYLSNYGTEGVSYEVDAQGNFVKFLDAVEAAPNGDSPSTARSYFARYSNWPHRGERMDYYDPDYIKVVKNTWTAEMEKHAMPPITHTLEENTVIAAKYSTLDTYCRESITKFILGTSPMSDWDKFIEEIKKLGVEEILALKQAAYDRYQER